MAVLIDGGWFTKAIEKHLAVRGVTAEQIYRNALALANDGEEVVKVFYYDSSPHEGKETNPITRQTVDYAQSPGNTSRKRLFKELGAMPMVALRRGVVRPRGWTLTQVYIDRLMRGNVAAPANGDVMLNFEQ